jgi:hypothetical protein
MSNATEPVVRDQQFFDAETDALLQEAIDYREYTLLAGEESRFSAAQVRQHANHLLDQLKADIGPKAFAAAMQRRDDREAAELERDERRVGGDL